MSDDIYTEEVQKAVSLNNRRFRNGYMVLFDIKDSTQRKKDQPERWHPQLSTFYAVMERFAKRLADLEDIFGTIEEKDRQPVVKFVGDGGFIFIPHCYHSRPEDERSPARALTQRVLEEVTLFRSATHANTQLGSLTIKSVVTYLTNLQPIPSDDLNQRDAPRDIVGRGIDFTFRLEAFGDAGYIVVNEMLHDSATKGLIGGDDKGQDTILINGAQHHFVECRKVIKGWSDDKGERFFVLFDPEDLQERFRPTISPSRKDVESEVMTFLLDRDKRTSRPSTRPANAPRKTKDSAVEELTQEAGHHG